MAVLRKICYWLYKCTQSKLAPTVTIHIFRTSLLYLPPSSFHQLRHTHGQMLLLWGFFTDPTLAFAQLSSYSFHQLRYTHGQMLILRGFFTDPTLAFAQHSSYSEISGLPIILLLREYWMLHIGPGILAIVWFGSSPTLPNPFPSVSSSGDTWEDWERETTCWRVTGVGALGGWARSRMIRAQGSLFLYIFIQYSPLLMYKNPGCLCRYETE